MARIYDEKFKVPHAAEPHYGIQISGGGILKVHRKEDCQGPNCCIHNPSDHALKDAPLNWRGDKRQMERLCPECGCGHPDPDDLSYHELVSPGSSEWMGVHGCCGACKGNCVNKEATP